ncbi:IPExxxVDY family protein [Flavobacteriaceae bacterium F89]|uniref:IPExxxVDY family protein n=1 Tax=Cerina litoralis TaxID=2874477 RepID=A0AAE3ETB8_9FLAO|nr:IPExxxVDY family protein [Cerina litoralis]MCG2459341.1 IPExxxVDY family protein [Cerina litoralis]
MAPSHKISDDFYGELYTYIALRSNLEDHALVFAINRFLKSNFKRTRKDLELSENVSFPVFEWKDLINDRYWTLIPNKCHKMELIKDGGLFGEEPSISTFYVVPEHREVDYILKLEQEDNDLENQLIKTLFKVPKILTAYTLDTTKMKHKNNLIF